MIDPGHTSVKDQQAEDEQAIAQELLLIQQLWNYEISIQVIKSDDEQAVYDEKGRDISCFEKRVALGTWKKGKGQHQEACPCCDMNDDLYG